MKGSQRERTVVRVAAEELQAVLRRRLGTGRVHYWTECKVRLASKRFRGRADAVVAGVLENGSVYTVCIEAKSRRTLHAIRGRAGCVAQFLLAGTVGGALGAITWWQIRGIWGVAACGVTFLVSGLAALWLLERSRFFSSRAAVLDQVARYPGNERWLAIAQDALDRSPHALDDLRADCQAAGVGLLGITRRGGSFVYHEATPDRDPGDMMSEYLRGEGMRQELMSGDSNRSTRSARVSDMAST